MDSADGIASARGAEDRSNRLSELLSPSTVNQPPGNGALVGRETDTWLRIGRSISGGRTVYLLLLDWGQVGSNVEAFWALQELNSS